MKLWTERETSQEEGRRNQSRDASDNSSSGGKERKSRKESKSTSTTPPVSEDTAATSPTGAEGTAPGASDTTSRIYEEAASLLAHNRAVLGQALARSGHTDRGIGHLEAACPEILKYQQNAQGRRDSKSESCFFSAAWYAEFRVAQEYFCMRLSELAPFRAGDCAMF